MGDVEEGATVTEGNDNAPTVEQLKSELAAKDAELAMARKNEEAARGYVQQVVSQLQSASIQPQKVDDHDFQETFQEDPEKAIGQLFEARVRPIYDDYLKNAAVTSRQLAKQALGENFTKYEKEIDELVSKQPLEARANPQVYHAAFDVVRAGHIDEEVDARLNERIERERKMQAESASPPGGRKGGSKALSEMEKAVARRFGLSEEEYRKSKEEHFSSGGQWRGRDVD